MEKEIALCVRESLIGSIVWIAFVSWSSKDSLKSASKEYREIEKFKIFIRTHCLRVSMNPILKSLGKFSGTLVCGQF